MGGADLDITPSPCLLARTGSAGPMRATRDSFVHRRKPNKAGPVLAVLCGTTQHGFHCSSQARSSSTHTHGEQEWPPRAPRNRCDQQRSSAPVQRARATRAGLGTCSFRARGRSMAAYRLEALSDPPAPLELARYAPPGAPSADSPLRAAPAAQWAQCAQAGKEGHCH